MRTSEILLSEVPDAIQVQVLYGPRIAVGNTKFCLLENCPMGTNNITE
jgi:hypothetical protein